MTTDATTDLKAELEAAVAATEADLTRLREENKALAEAFREEPSDEGREGLKRAAASLAVARDKHDAARSALRVFEKTGTPHGLTAEDGKVSGTFAVLLKPGISKGEREDAIGAVIGEALEEAALELGVVLAASPVNYTRERPGRDAQGLTVVEVLGRVEGDRLMPAVSRAARGLRQ